MGKVINLKNSIVIVNANTSLKIRVNSIKNKERIAGVHRVKTIHGMTLAFDDYGHLAIL